MAAFRPFLATSAATALSAASSRPVSIRSQPSSASDIAMPWPMPRLAPVTSATLFLNPNSIAVPTPMIAVFAGNFGLFGRAGNGMAHLASERPAPTARSHQPV